MAIGHFGGVSAHKKSTTIRTVLLLALMAFAAALLAACETTPTPGGPVIGRPQPVEPPLPTPDPEGEEPTTIPRGHDPSVVRVALLLPFSDKSANVQTIAQAMSNAAQMAAFESGNQTFLLIPKDTGGTAEGARAAAHEALMEGAEIIIGPLYKKSVIAVAEITRPNNVPVIAFSSDMAIAGDGVFLLSHPPEMEIARVTDFAISKGYSRFGIIAPATEYGDRVSQSFAEEVFVRGGIVVAQERYEQSADAMMLPAKRLAQLASKPGSAPIVPRDSGIGNEGMLQDPGDGFGYQAVLMPESGTLLRALAPLLPYYKVDTRRIKLLGVSAWNNPRLAREPALAGGWFAAPDPQLSDGFRQRYKSVFGDKPPRLASLAYDAALLTARLSDRPWGERFTIEAIANPNGYLGADGLFRLLPTGEVERGLAILEIQPSGIKVIDPAPRSFVREIDYSDGVGY